VSTRNRMWWSYVPDIALETALCIQFPSQTVTTGWRWRRIAGWYFRRISSDTLYVCPSVSSPVEVLGTVTWYKSIRSDSLFVRNLMSLAELPRTACNLLKQMIIIIIVLADENFQYLVSKRQYKCTYQVESVLSNKSFYLLSLRSNLWKSLFAVPLYSYFFLG
jgi:hypothetical protein